MAIDWLDELPDNGMLPDTSATASTPGNARSRVASSSSRTSPSAAVPRCKPCAPGPTETTHAGACGVDPRGQEPVLCAHPALCIEHPDDDPAAGVEPVDESRRQHAGHVVDHEHVELEIDRIVLREHRAHHAHATVVTDVVDQLRHPGSL